MGRIAAVGLPIAVALLLTLPNSSAAATTHSWSAPFMGKFTTAGSRSTGHCLGAANDTTRFPTTFNHTLGVVHFGLEANVNGTTCGAAVTDAKILSTFTFTTLNFSVTPGLHHITISWAVKWFAQLTVNGGRGGHPLPASASYRIGVNGAQLCDMTNASCIAFPNSSARSSVASHAWMFNATATGANYSAIKSATVTLYLNTTFTAHDKYRISSSLFGFASAKARLTGHTARAYLLLLPILGGSARLVGISVN
jgi:hypothetical protein